LLLLLLLLLTNSLPNHFIEASSEVHQIPFIWSRNVDAPAVDQINMEALLQNIALGGGQWQRTVNRSTPHLRGVYMSLNKLT